MLVTGENFSARCHYPLIFPMSTLYYASVFFLFSQRIRSLAPFTEIDSDFSKGLDKHLKDVGDAFAQQNVTGEPERIKSEIAQNGLWEPAQNNMGAIVRKEEWYVSYPEFCRIFVDLGPKREDHVFMRALDFFGAHSDGPLLTTDGAKSIATALDRLLEFLEKQSKKREAAERKRPIARHQ